MKYRVDLENRAQRELLELPKEIQRRLSTVLDDLQVNPRPPGAKKLIGKEGYRIRKGDYRILYTINDPQLLVQIYRIGHRREIYR
jgi:mRNA interferase RelE/StbE